MAQITLNSSGVASSGALVLQSNGTTTAVTISTGQVATLEKDAVVNGLTVGRGAGAVSTNTAVGASALAANTTGYFNAASGYQALAANTTGAGQTATGYYSLLANTTGSENTAYGSQSLQTNTTGNNNVAVGRLSLYSNTTASDNTAVGYQAGYSTTTGYESVNLGSRAGYSQTTARGNVIIGKDAGYSTTGGFNTFVGFISGNAVTTGTKNTILGAYGGNQGGLDIRTSSNRIVLSDGDGNPRGQFDNGTGFVLQGVGNAANPYITSFDSSLYAYGRSASSSGVYLANNATSWASTSDERRKDIIEPITNATEKLLTLRTVIGKFKVDEDGTRRPFLIAQDVLAVFPEAVNHQEDEDGEFLGMSYTDMIPLLVASIKELKADLDATKAELAALKGTS